MKFLKHLTVSSALLSVSFCAFATGFNCPSAVTLSISADKFVYTGTFDNAQVPLTDSFGAVDDKPAVLNFPYLTVNNYSVIKGMLGTATFLNSFIVYKKDSNKAAIKQVDCYYRGSEEQYYRIETPYNDSSFTVSADGPNWAPGANDNMCHANEADCRNLNITQK